MTVEENINSRFDINITFFKVFSCDIISFILGLFYLYYLAVLLLVIVSVFIFGTDTPKESVLEFFLGFVLATLIFIIALKLRISLIKKLLGNGESVEAEVMKGVSYQFFVHIIIQYQINNERIKKRLLLPNTKGPRKLIDEPKLILSKEINKRKKVIVRSLYVVND